MTDALHVMIKNHSVPVEYAVASDLDEDVSREKLERRVIEDLIFRDNRYKTRIDDVTDAIVGAKKMVLENESPEKIAEFIALKTVESEESRVESANNNSWIKQFLHILKITSLDSKLSTLYS